MSLRFSRGERDGVRRAPRTVVDMSGLLLWLRWVSGPVRDRAGATRATRVASPAAYRNRFSLARQRVRPFGRRVGCRLGASQLHVGRRSALRSKDTEVEGH